MNKRFSGSHTAERVCILFVFISISFISSAQEYLYGLTQKGGYYNMGAPYQIETSGQGFLAYGDFDGNNGGNAGNGSGFIQIVYQDRLFSPISALTQAGDQNLDHGMHVDIKPGQGGIIPPFNFMFGQDGTGFNPGGKFLLACDGLLYGMTSTAGEFNGGSLFYKSAITGPLPTHAISFDGVNKGRSPKGSLIQGPQGELFGMTEFGGINDLGVIFSYNVVTGQFKKLLDFNGLATGSNPTGSLVLANDGKLYGLTRSGGSANQGVVFRINTDGTAFTKLQDLNTTSGTSPLGSLIQHSDGVLYGLTSAGGSTGFGTIFSLTTAGIFNKLIDFNGPNGKSPVGDLVSSPSSPAMYGVTYAGGANDKGVMFKFENCQLNKLYDFVQSTGSNPVGSLMMTRKFPDMDFADMPEKTTLSVPFTPDIQVPDGLPVYLTSNHPGTAIIENNQIKILGPGNVIITAYVAGNHEYLPRFITKFLTIVKAPQTIDFPPISPKTFGDAPFTLSATSSSGLPVRITTFSNEVVSSDGINYYIKNAGSITMRAIQEGNTTYSSAEVTRELVVNPAEQHITFNAPSAVTCCQTFTLNATSSSGLDVDFKSADWEKVSINDYGVGTVHGLGSVSVSAYSNGNRNYKPAEEIRTINLLKGSQSIFFSIPTNVTYQFGQNDVFLNSYSSSGLPVSYTSQPPGIAVVEGNYLRFIGVGTTTITARQNGNDLISAAAPVTQTITVVPPTTPGAGNVITFNNLNLHFVNDGSFNLIAKATSGLPVSYQSSNTAVAEVSGNLVTIKSSGTTTITAIQPGGGNIPAATSVQRVLTVQKQYQYIGLESYHYLKFGDQPIQLPSRSSANLPLTYNSSSPSIAYVDENYFLHLVSSGEVVLTASQPGNLVYDAVEEKSTRIYITPLYQDLIFSELPSKTFGDPSFTLSAIASSGLPVVYVSSNLAVATINGSTVTILGAGTTTISAQQQGYPGYGYAQVNRQLVVNKANQTITFGPLPDKNFTDDPFTVSATSNSNLPITFSSAAPTIASANGNKITIHGTGTTDIIATQIGDENYLPAHVSQKLKINNTGNVFDMVGSTVFGGANNSGLIYTMKTDGSSISTLKTFSPRTMPFPQGGFIKGTDGKIYGNFTMGGTRNYGAIVRLEADGTGMTIIHNFNEQTGGTPFGNIMQASDGDLYGMTNSGGLIQGGTIFKLKTDGTGYTILHELSLLDGVQTLGGLTEASNGKLYGMTTVAGFFGFGTIFSIAKDGSDFTVIYRFKEILPVKSGYQPRGDLVQGIDGYLYGTLSQGGENGNGVLFKIQLDGSGFTRIVNFDGVTKGSMPGSSVIIGSDGKIYGLTQKGGTHNQGTLFAVNTDGSNFTRLFNFDGTTTGGNTVCKLTEGSDGFLYGTTNTGGANSLGTAFKISKNGIGFQKLEDFDASASQPLFGPLVEAQPGKFVGMTSTGGASGGGAVFSLTSSGVFSIVADFPQEESNPSILIGDNAGEFYYGIAQSGKPSIFRIKNSGEYDRILEIPSDVQVSKLYYISTGHLWCTGTKNNQAYTFRIKTDGTEFEVITELPASRGVDWLTEKSDGTLLGVTSRATMDEPGSIFTIQNDGSGFSSLGLMPTGTEFHGSNFLHGSDEEIYAISTYGHTLYRFENNQMTTVTELPADVGQVPMKLIELNGGRIGVLMRSGQIFSIDKDGSQFTTILHQTNELLGTNPQDMVQSFDGWIYVAASMGGTHNKGVIYKVLSDGSSYTPLHQFTGENGDSPGNIIFKKIPQTFTFNLLDPVKTSDAAFKPVTTSSANAKITLKSSNPAVASIDDGKINPRSKGTTIITASIPNNANFYNVAPIQRELVVTKETQSILFTNPDTKVLGDQPFDLQVSTSSGLPISFELLSENITLTGTKVTLVTAGMARIKATQSGDGNFESAEAVEISFCVNPPKPLITMTSSTSGRVLTSSNTIGNQWYFNNDIIPDATQSTLRPSESGTYTVTTMIGNCSSATSDAYELVITSTNPDPEVSFDMFPNPTDGFIYVQLNGHRGKKITIQLLDSFGRVVESKNGLDGELNFDLTERASGIYIIKVISDKGTSSRKFVRE